MRIDFKEVLGSRLDKTRGGILNPASNTIFAEAHAEKYRNRIKCLAMVRSNVVDSTSDAARRVWLERLLIRAYRGGDMSNRFPMGSANAPSGACVTAMLAIPNDAIRVVAAPPDTISQRNVEATTGVPSRAYLEAVRDPGFPLAVTRLGKLRIVNRAAFIAWLEKGAFGGARREEQDDELADECADGREGDAERADEILDALGLHTGPTKTKKGKTSARG